MSNTANLNIVELVQDQAKPEIVVNTALEQLDAMAGEVSVAISPTTGTMTLTEAQARAGVIRMTGTLTGNLDVEIPAALDHSFIMYNGTAGAFVLSVKYVGNATKIVIPKACAVPIYKNGSAVGFGVQAVMAVPLLIAELAADQTISTNTETVVHFDTVVTDNAGKWDGTNFHYVCPEAGLYMVMASVRITVASGVVSGSIQAYAGVRKNGTLYRKGVQFHAETSADTHEPTVSCLVPCAKGDTLDVVGYHNFTTTGAKNIKGVTSSTWMNLRLVSYG